MPNTNCLKGLSCPKCHQEDRLFITACTVVEVTDEGAEIASDGRGDIHWNEGSWAECPDCRFHASLIYFETANRERVLFNSDGSFALLSKE